jgi:hypothetical protein
MPAADIDVTGPNHLAIRIDAHDIAATKSRSRSVSHWLPDGRLARNEARATVSLAINRFCEVGGDGSNRIGGKATCLMAVRLSGRGESSLGELIVRRGDRDAGP